MTHSFSRDAESAERSAVAQPRSAPQTLNKVGEWPGLTRERSQQTESLELSETGERLSAD
jgi:hypothetical protein